jgi:hypothetical protein
MAARIPPTAGTVLGDLLERLDVRDRLRAYGVWNVWAEEVGEIIAAKTEPIRIEDGKLFVRVGSSTWMQELQYLKDEIRTRLNRRLGAPIVRDLYLVLGRSPRKRPSSEPPPDRVVDEAEIRRLVPDTGRPELDDALRRIARARARRVGPDGDS